MLDLFIIKYFPAGAKLLHGPQNLLLQAFYHRISAVPALFSTRSYCIVHQKFSRMHSGKQLLVCIDRLYAGAVEMGAGAATPKTCTILQHYNKIICFFACPAPFPLLKTLC